MFAHADLGDLTAVREPVLLSTGSHPGAHGRWAGQSGAGSVIWSTPISDNVAEPAAIRLAVRPGVRTVTVVAGAADDSRCGLASAFAVHLAEVRAATFLDGVWITAVDRPGLRPGWVRLPHLVTTTTGGDLDDAVVWELMPAALVPRWLGAPLPDQAFVEAHLDALLALRRAARNGHLPATAEGRHLASLLRDRYLSLRLVYQHPHLFTALLPAFEGSR
ncbi:hypothetical protein [Actinoplanes sp. NPDC049118]|uniref:hypothetical protein n=1 Tax=Actinoplanes sp. NPDC049118 TaxID=3155769 RepID=UPI003407FD66